METATPPRSARWALSSLALAMLLSSLGTSIANVGLPSLAQAFSATFREVQWVVLAYLAAIALLVVGAGRLGDRYGRRRVLLAGIALFTAASALCALASTLEFLVAARFAQGAGAAVLMALTMAFVGDIVPKARTGSAMGLLGTLSATGTALGPTLGGVLLAGPGWQGLFLVNVPLGALAFVLARRFLPFDRNPALSGSARFMRAGMLRDPGLGAGLGMSAIVTTVMMGTLIVGPFYLSRALGLDTASVGLAMSAGPLAAALTGIVAGRVADRFGAARTLTGGLAAMAAASLGLATLGSANGVAGYIAPMLVLTIGYSLFQTANNTVVMVDVRPEERGLVSGLLNLSRNLGLIAGASVMGAVFALGSGTPDVAAAPAMAVGAGMRAAFALATVLVCAALALSLAARRAAVPAFAS